MYSRRKFIRNSVLGATALGLYPLKSFSLNTSDSDIQITILHTNDMHSHIEPFLSGRNKGLGGMAQRSLWWRVRV